MATTPRTSAAGHTLPGSKLRRVTEHIQAHLGAVVYMSPYYFARRFQHSTGLAPHRFVVQQRIARARAFLATQEQSIAEISRLVGFRTPSHFTTVFRRVTGLTPGAYRTAGPASRPARPERRVR